MRNFLPKFNRIFDLEIPGFESYTVHSYDLVLQDAIARLERQYEEDKQTALEKQRQEYEKHFQQLKSYMSPSTPFPPFGPYDPFLRIGSKMTPTTPTVMSRLEKWGQQR